LYVVQCPKRDAMQKALADAGVGTLIHYPIPPHLQAAYSDKFRANLKLPLAEQMANHVLSLPMGPHLSEQDATAVIERVLHCLS
jgi:dTDP-4-amino-4,6-dideoxygalactose transaminase